jgi:hypothetical protein
MTTEELAAGGLPAEPEVLDHEIAQPLEENASPPASGSWIHEDGEIRSEEEEVGNVDADVKDLIAAKQSGPLHPSFVFGESKVTANLIREYECRMDLPGPTTSVGTRTDYSVGPWGYPACATRHLKAWSTRTAKE